MLVVFIGKYKGRDLLNTVILSFIHQNLSGFAIVFSVLVMMLLRAMLFVRQRMFVKQMSRVAENCQLRSHLESLCSRSRSVRIKLRKIGLAILSQWAHFFSPFIEVVGSTKKTVKMKTKLSHQSKR